MIQSWMSNISFKSSFLAVATISMFLPRARRKHIFRHWSNWTDFTVNAILGSGKIFFVFRIKLCGLLEFGKNSFFLFLCWHWSEACAPFSVPPNHDVYFLPFWSKMNAYTTNASISKLGHRLCRHKTSMDAQAHPMQTWISRWQITNLATAKWNSINFLKGREFYDRTQSVAHTIGRCSFTSA